MLTVVDGKIVHATEEFSAYNPDLPPVSSDWSPVAHHGRYNNHHTTHRSHGDGNADHEAHHGHAHVPILGPDGRVWQTGCGCNV